MVIDPRTSVLSRRATMGSQESSSIYRTPPTVPRMSSRRLSGFIIAIRLIENKYSRRFELVYATYKDAEWDLVGFFG